MNVYHVQSYEEVKGSRYKTSQFHNCFRQWCNNRGKSAIADTRFHLIRLVIHRRCNEVSQR